MNYESHPGVLLKEHLVEVARKCRNTILLKNIEHLDKNILADSSYLIGISHDFGKYTEYFQKSRINKIPIMDENLGNHGLLSALFTFVTLREYVLSRCLNEHPLYSFLPLIGFFIVKHHHGNLDNIENDVDSEKLFYSDFKHIEKQVINILQHSSQINIDYSELLSDYDISASKLLTGMEKYKTPILYDCDIENIINDSLQKPIRVIIQWKNLEIYLITQLLFSTLIDADKKNAGKVRSIERKEIPVSLVENHIQQPNFKSQNQSKINHIRNEIRHSVLGNINSKDKIFTLTAPTGTGKTLASLSAALKLRKLLKQELNLDHEPRIIYSLPFTSIINQSFEEFDKVFKQIKDYKTRKSEYLLKHHYLSDVFYKTQKKDIEIEVGESLALIESWESEIVITTFIQLFHALIG